MTTEIVSLAISDRATGSNQYPEVVYLLVGFRSMLTVFLASLKQHNLLIRNIK